MSNLYGGIEGGGTKFVCIVASGPGDIRAESRFPTTSPPETIGRVIEFFRETTKEERLAAIGVASFGPVDLDPSSPLFGHITSTPKPRWAGTDLVGPLKTTFDVPVGSDTDVNGPAPWGNTRWGGGNPG